METEIIAITISLISLGISIYLITRNKAILVAEKHSLTIKKPRKEVWLYFYLTNVGERPTTIKSVDFHTDSRYMPKTQILKVIDETIIGIGEDLPTKPNMRYETIDMPFLLEPHTSIKLLAKLDFVDMSVFKRETTNDKLHYTLRLMHSPKKPFEQRL